MTASFVLGASGALHANVITLAFGLSLLWPLLSAAIIIAAAVAVAAFCWLALRFMPNNYVGVVEKLWSAAGSVPEGQITALAGEAGFQADLLRGGIHFGYWRWQYRIHKAPLVTVPQGKIGYVYARDGEPLSLVSQWEEPENRGSLELEPVELVQPTPQDLSKYAGEYVSDELAATYRLTVRDGQLWLRVNSRRWEQLDATVRDELVPHVRDATDGRIFRFLANNRGEIDVLSASYYRVSGVRFAKR